MAKQINVDLRVNADVKQAKAQINALQKSLTELGNSINFSKGFGSEFTGQMKEAQKEISLLKAQIQSAVNVDTGKLDFSKFNTELKNSGKSLESYAATLSNLGPKGTEAFMQLTRAISNSEIPILRINNRLKELGTALANTARWQISSTMLHGFAGAIQTAYRYAQDLNESLNDIRIVTGQSEEQMAAFADRANKAAQALSATTTEYTKASLIFYQQGLSDAEVEARTNTTIKMAHAAGESASQVSSYMTAIWNNFAEGADNLEYYGDVITKLGATTAASSAEIAGGLEKFASVADTVGLSYEYAAAAVTTIVDKTRQSEDVVGTSLKTIFARLEGLQLGDTLDDGTDLNKYSQALLTVGVNIKDANGGLKDMDTILDELGGKWQTLTKDQQVALAQTVGGMRQYNQFIALMDNFEAFQENISVARGAEGSLQAQADIYAESWEGAQKRVQAAAQAIYQDLIDDKFFIEILNKGAEILNFVDDFIDSLGGLEGILKTILPLVTTIFSKQITSGIQNAIYNVTSLVPGNKELLEQRRQTSIDNSLEALRKKYGQNSVSYLKLQDEINYNKAMSEFGEKMSDIDKNALSLQHQINQANLDDLKTEKEKLDILIKQNEQKRQQYEDYLSEAITNDEYQRSQLEEIEDHATKIAELRQGFSTKESELDSVAKSKAVSQFFDNIDSEQVSWIDENILKDTEINLKKLSDDYIEAGEDQDKLSVIYNQLYENLKTYNDTISENVNAFLDKDLKEQVKQFTSGISPADEKIGDLQKSVRGSLTKFGFSDSADLFSFDKGGTKQEAVKALTELKTKLEQQNDGTEKYTKAIQSITKKLQTYEKEIDEYNAKIEEETNKLANEVIPQAEMSAEENIRSRQYKGNIPKSDDYTKQAKEASEQLAKNQALITSFQSLAQTVFGLSAAYTQLSSVANTWKMYREGEISGTQALAQTIMSLGMVLPTLTNTLASIKSLNEAYGLLNGNLLKTAATTVFTSLAIKTKTFATEEDAVAALKDTVANQGLAGAFKLTGLMAKESAGSFLAANAALLPIIAIIGAIILAQKLYQAEQEKLSKSIEENTEKINKNNETLEETKQKTELYKNVVKLGEAYRNNTGTLDSYRSALISAAEAHGIQEAAILAEAGAYELLERRIREAQAAEDQRTITAAGQNYNLMLSNESLAQAKDTRSFGNFLENMFNIRTTGGTAFGSIYRAIEQRVGSDYANRISYGLSLGDETTVIDLLSSLGISGVQASRDTGVSIDWASLSQEENIRLLEAFQRISEDAAFYSGEIGDNLREMGEELGGWGNLYTQASGDYDSLIDSIVRTTLNERDLSDITSVTDLNTFIEDFSQELEAQSYSASQTEDKILDYFQYTMPDIYRDYALVKAYAQEQNITLNEALNDYEENGRDFIASAIGATAALSNLTGTVSELTSLLENIQLGDRISPEDYTNKLNEYQQSFFQEMIDGTYMLVGNAEDLWRYTQEQFRLDSTNKILGLQAQREEIQANLASFAAIEELPNLSGFTQNVTSAQILTALNQGRTSGEIVYGSEIEQSYNNLLSAVYSREMGEDISDEAILDLIDVINIQLSGNEDIQAVSREAIKDAQTKLEELEDQIFEQEKIQAFSYEDEGELRAAFDEGQFGERAFMAAEEHLREMERLAGLDAEEVQNLQEDLLDTIPALAGNSEAARELAIHIAQMNQGIETLASNWENWSDALSHPEEIEEYGSALRGARTALSDVLDISEEFITDNLILDHFNDIALAAQGDADAIDRLKEYAREDILLKIRLDSDLSESAFADFVNEFESKLPDDLDISIGTTLDDADMINALQSMIDAADMTADEVNAYLASMGYEANFASEQKPVETVVPDYITKHSITDMSEDGREWTETTETIENGSHTVTNEIGAWAMSTDGTNPVIKSITRTGTYGASRSSSRKSGGGGGGSSKKKDAKQAETEKERYYTITRQIKDQEDAINRLSKAKDRAFGQARLQYLDRESKALEQELKLQEQYLAEIEDYYAQDKGNIAAFGAQFDSNGVITNYDEIVQKQIDEYNAAMASGSEAAQDIAEQKYEYFKKVLDQYDETNQLWQSEMDKLQDLKNQYYDLQLEKIETELEIKIEINDDALKILEYRLDRIKDKAFSTAEALSTMMGKLAIEQSNQAYYGKSIEQILANHGVTLDDVSNLNDDQIAALGFTQKEIEMLRSGMDNLISTQEKIDEIQNAIIDGPLEVMKEWNDEYERLNKAFEHSDKIIKSLVNITDLTRANTGLDSSFILGLQRAQYGVGLDQLEGSKVTYEANKELMEEARRKLAEAIADGADENTIDRLRKNLQEMEEMVNQSEERMYTNLENVLKQSQELLKDTVKVATESFQEAVTATGDLNFDDTTFDHLKKIDDLYLDDYEKIYQFSKLTSDINKSMSKETSTANLERYGEVLAEIQELEESGAEVSQYEVDALRAKYELAQAYAALEDAQFAKTTVRMRRDSEGNYGYVYSAGDTDDAFNNYRDKLYAYQKLNSEYVKSEEQEYGKLIKEISDAYSKVWTDTSLSKDEKNKRIAELNKYYGEIIKNQQGQLKLALENNKELYDGFWTSFHEIYGYALSEEQDYQTQFSNTILGVLFEDMADVDELYDNVTNNMVTYTKRGTDAVEQYTIDQEIALNAAGTSMEEFEGKAMQAMGTVVGASDAAKTAIKDSTKTMIDDFNKVINIFDIMNNLGLDKMRSEVLNSVTTLGQLIAKFAEVSQAAQDVQKNIQATAAATTSFTANISNVANGGLGGIAGTSPSVIPTMTQSSTLTNNQYIELEKWLANAYFNRTYSTTGLRDWGYVSNLLKDPQINMIKYFNSNFNQLEFLNALKNNPKAATKIYEEIKKKYGSAIKFDTGGYTGAWNSNSGKLAILHEKELVLNKQDTENMLKMVEMAREALAVNRLAFTNNIPSSGRFSSSNDFQQIVNINADFSGVQNSREIEEAFNNLVNQALQYSNRKNF